MADVALGGNIQLNQTTLVSPFEIPLADYKNLRVRTEGDGGTSDWVSVPPLEVPSPPPSPTFPTPLNTTVQITFLPNRWFEIKNSFNQSWVLYQIDSQWLSLRKNGQPYSFHPTFLEAIEKLAQQSPFSGL